MKYIKLLIFIIAVELVAFKPSFDPQKARTEVEKLIIGSKDLCILDSTLSERYSSLYKVLNESEKQILKKEQLKWIKTRDNRIKQSSISHKKIFTIDEYKSRITGLQKTINSLFMKEVKEFLVKGTLHLNYHSNKDCAEESYSLDDNILDYIKQNQIVDDNYLNYSNSTKVDIDNDGVEDIRIAVTVGSIHREINYFILNKGSGYEYLEAESDLFSEEEGGGGLYSNFMKFCNKNYLIKHNTYDQTYEIFLWNNKKFKILNKLSVNNNISSDFSIETDISDKRLKENSYKKLKNLLKEISTSNNNYKVYCLDETMINKKHEDYFNEDLWSLRMDNSDDQWSFIDINNDNSLEVMRKYKGGRGAWLSLSIFYKKGGKYLKNIEKECALIDSINKRWWKLPQKQDIVFIKHKDHYFPIKISSKITDFNEEYTFTIFDNKNNELIKVGSFQAKKNKAIKVEEIEIH